MKDFTHTIVLAYAFMKIKEFAVIYCRFADNLAHFGHIFIKNSSHISALPNHWKSNMIIYGLKNCDVVRKARKALPEAKMHDVRDAPLSREKLESLLAVFPDSLVNKRSTAWRKLSDEARAGDQIALLQAHPALMKRPLIEAGDSYFLGWTPENEAALAAM